MKKFLLVITMMLIAVSCGNDDEPEIQRHTGHTGINCPWVYLHDKDCHGSHCTFCFHHNRFVYTENKPPFNLMIVGKEYRLCNDNTVQL